MRIIQSFAMLLAAIFLFMAPFSQAVYDFRTDQRTDNYYATTGIGGITANVVLSHALWSNDNSTFEITSSNPLDAPVFVSFNTTSRLTGITGLTSNNTRTLYVAYDTSVLVSNVAIDTLLNQLPWLYFLLVTVFMGTAVAAIWVGRY